MSELSEYFDDVNRLLFGEEGAFTEAGNAVSAKVNELKGYVAGRFDHLSNTFNDATVQNIPNINTTSTPIYYFLDKFNQGGYAEERAQAELLHQRSGIYDSIINQLREMQEIGAVYLPDGEYLDKIFPDRQADDKFTVEEGINVLQQRQSQLAQERQSISTNAVDTAESFIQGAQALSPLLIAVSGYKPEWTRSLMGLQLGLDALTGVLNFRTPGRESSFGFMQTVNPYLTMAGIAASAEISRRFSP
jgi:hypothetical protein